MAITRRLKDANDESQLEIATTQLVGGSNGSMLVRDAGVWTPFALDDLRDQYPGIVYHYFQIQCVPEGELLPRTDDWVRVATFINPAYPQPARLRARTSNAYIWAFTSTPASMQIEIDIHVEGTSIFTIDDHLVILEGKYFDDASGMFVDDEPSIADVISVFVRMSTIATGGEGLRVGFHYIAGAV